MNRGWIVGVLASGAACVLTGQAQANTVLLTANYDSYEGRFGQRTETRVTAVTAGAVYVGKGYRFGAFIPHLTIEGPGVVVAGAVANTAGSGAARPATRESKGVGDVLLTASKDWVGEAGKPGWLLSTTALLKLPTGDEKAGLGTGKSDQAVQVENTYRFGNGVSLGLTVGRQFYGKTARLALQDGNYSTLAVGFPLGAATQVQVLASRRDAVTPTSVARQERTLSVTHAITAKAAIQFTYTQGDSPSSPDRGMGVGLIGQW